MLLKSAGDEPARGGVLAARLSAKLELQETYDGARYAHGLEAELQRLELSAPGQVERSSETQGS